MDAICRFGVEATLVANEFIDRYMADANGEYVKVYLYLLRHHQEKPDVGQIADALNHTEADVRRALSYWEKLGALTLSSSERSAMENQGAYLERQRFPEKFDTARSLRSGRRQGGVRPERGSQ